MTLHMQTEPKTKANRLWKDNVFPNMQGNSISYHANISTPL